MSKRKQTTKVWPVYLIRAVESEQGIHTCQGRLRVDATFYPSFGLDNVEQLFKGALERKKLLDVLILRDQQLPETKAFCKRQPRENRTDWVC